MFPSTVPCSLPYRWRPAMGFACGEKGGKNHCAWWQAKPWVPAHPRPAWFQILCIQDRTGRWQSCHPREPGLCSKRPYYALSLFTFKLTSSVAARWGLSSVWVVQVHWRWVQSFSGVSTMEPTTPKHPSMCPHLPGVHPCIHANKHWNRTEWKWVCFLWSSSLFRDFDLWILYNVFCWLTIDFRLRMSVECSISDHILSARSTNKC